MKFLHIVAAFLLGASTHVMAQSTIYHVTAEATATDDGTTWDSPITLTSALAKAKAGDQIWVKGYDSSSLGNSYTAPKTGFVLPSGVSMYGGFKGDETSVDERVTVKHKYNMKYQTVLLGDISYNDDATSSLLIYPENTTRSDNANHILTMQMGVTDDNTNDNNQPTVLSGFVIAGGHAAGESTENDGRGGGVLVTNVSSRSSDTNAAQRSFRITQCYFVSNYAVRGGAMYVDKSCTNAKSSISYCSVFNNVAGMRSGNSNEGGGLWIDGSATVYNTCVNNNTAGGVRLSTSAKMVNCTVIANSVSAVDLTVSNSGLAASRENGAVYNTVLWHSTTLSKQDTKPLYKSCAYPEVVVTDATNNCDADGNVYISYQNHSTSPAAWFEKTTVNTGYDRSFNARSSVNASYSFAFEETSELYGKANSTYYQNYVATLESGSTDVLGNRRIESDGKTLDIGAYEYVRLGSGRIRYVKEGGTGKGMSWDDAMGDIQDAINALADDNGTKGEVWVAGGTYTVKNYIDATNQSSPIALLMKNGISVYGGFNPTAPESSRKERLANNTGNGKPWHWAHPTILHGSNYTEAKWNATSQTWEVTSGSYHVVWFAPLPGKSAFTSTVYLEGITVEGGKSESQTNDYQPDCGAGVYMADVNAYLRYCTVRYCNLGLSTSETFTPRGGGVYCKDGNILGCLVYNNTAANGGGIYVDGTGFVTRSMVTNNSGHNGAGVYLKKADTDGQDYYQILSTSVVTNNTATLNGSVYLDGSGLLMNNTIANNYVNNSTDAANKESAQTAGIYITENGLVENNILWNNSLRQTSTTKTSTSLAQIFALNPTRETVRFYSNAISDVNAASWSNIYQSGTTSLTSDYQGKGFVLGGTDTPFNTADDFNDKRGVISTLTDVNYFWESKQGSIFRNTGTSYPLLPSADIYQPQQDLNGKTFKSTPSAGAYMPDNNDVVFAYNHTKHSLRLYFDRATEIIDGNGSSWAKAYSSSSVDEIYDYLATINNGDVVNVITSDGTATTHTIDKTSSDYFEICARSGTFAPPTTYTFEENDPLSKCFRIQPTVLPLTVLGGFPTYAQNPDPSDDERNPVTYRTELHGNINGKDLSTGLNHLLRIEAGANVTIDGYAFTHAYAAGTAHQPYGGGVLIGSVDKTTTPTKVTLQNCIFEDNTALSGAAVSTLPDAVNVTLRMENCVVNNNTCGDANIVSNSLASTSGAEPVISVQGTNNTLTLDHVTIINNQGAAPASIGTSSYAAGNVVKANGIWTSDGANNTLATDFATLGEAGAANFSNPTKTVGAQMSGNVYYGGKAEFRPLTSSSANSVIINQATQLADSQLHLDLPGRERTLGGAPDLGAYEAILPKAGKVIYVRSYNTTWDTFSDANYDDQDGTPDFNLLKTTTTEYDGTSWGKAIIGNAMCDVTQARSGNDFYVKTSDNTLLNTTINNSDYATIGGTYGTATNQNSYTNFFTNSGNTWGSKTINGASANTITNDRYERYLSGLQYAVEKAAEYNKSLKAGEDSVVVWVGAGIYTDYKGFVVRNGVKVYGGFPKDGNPGESDRHPLLSQYVPARKGYEGLTKTDYETILQIRKESPVYMTKGSKELWYQENKPADGSKYNFTTELINDQSNVIRRYVLRQPDVCMPTYSASGDGTNPTQGNCSRLPDATYADPAYQEYSNVKWDGFSIRHGYIIRMATHGEEAGNRDGGGGVRVFRGVQLENLIIVNNFNYGHRVRAGGLYMDGTNSTISNSFLLRNFAYSYASKESYGGGAYMIQGTGYNLVVANNRAIKGTSRGGGIFLESAKFYNNTIAYNESNEGSGIFHWQDGNTGVESQLTLYNCILYDNFTNSKVVGNQINSSSVWLMQPSHNCYVNQNFDDDLLVKFPTDNGNYTSASLAYPFSDQTYASGGTTFLYRNARFTNDYRLYEDGGLSGNQCLNTGTTDVGTGVTLPSTDMDYTDRIKDCAIDIGAYEADNSTNITPQEKTNSSGITDYVYYVTQNGWGNRSGDSPANAACADKLQSVLTAAGIKAKTVNDGITTDSQKHKVYVKVAGYKTNENGERFVYHANTLADSNDPQSYTFLVPDGVWLMGGYYEGESENGTPTGYNWDNDQRDCITEYQTVLSAKTEVKEGSAVTQEVNGYHTITFGKWPTGEIEDYYMNAVEYRAVVDGVHLIDGQATDNSGFKGMGGAAVVPNKAHIRNCIISDCEALKGGALCMLKGGMVTGTLMRDNTAQEGGAIYAPTCGEENAFHAYIINNTIAGNSATTGGGIYHDEKTVMVGNCVIWGNTATTDKNISGAVDTKAADYVQGMGDTSVEYYPYNYCFVEKMELPANIQNTEMTSDLTTYFTNSGEYYPRAYSPLVGNGVESAYAKAWSNVGISLYDLKGVARNLTGKLTGGCYAMSQPAIQDGRLLLRLFVSNEGGEEVSDEDKQEYIGRSFLTPFNSLDAALAYIKEVRSTKLDDDTYMASDTTHFEILMTGGTYKPGQMRDDATLAEGEIKDRRLQSFSIPVNVEIFGSFYDTDYYSSDPVNPKDYTKIADGATSFTTYNGTTLTPNGSIKDILAERNKNHMGDSNGNGLIEPWEFNNPTIFSGDIKSTSNEKKVHHVVYSKISSTESSADLANDVVLDGITIMDGQTSDALNTEEGVDEELDEVGRGGAIYTCRVNYTLNRCRLLKNTGLHGGAIYANDASLDIIGSALCGNQAHQEEDESVAGSDPGQGGAVYLYLTKSTNGNLHAVNSLFANNDVENSNSSSAGASQGGAIFIRHADDTSGTTDSYNEAIITNCLIVNNKAAQNAGVHLENALDGDNLKPILYNTVLWGNESSNTHVKLNRKYMWHCASDVMPDATGSTTSDGNITLSTDNFASNGPRFTAPTTKKGSDGYDMAAKWNPTAISILTDAGDGVVNSSDVESGKYKDWWDKHSARLTEFGYPSEYVRNAGSASYARYVGPLSEDGTVQDKPIDIGLYEFQYVFKFSDFDAVYIGTEEKGTGDGSSWDNQSTDLRGAIVAMANPSGNTSATDVKTDRKVYVRDGEYFSTAYSSDDAFSLIVNNGDKQKFVTSLEIVGSCTGSTDTNGKEIQDFSKPTVLVPNPSKAKTQNLLNITMNGKPVTLSGITFRNESTSTDCGVGVNADINSLTVGTEKNTGKLTIHHCAFRHNHNTALNVKNNEGIGLNIYNVLFADGDADAMKVYADDNKTASKGVKGVNLTFVKNQGTALSGTQSVHNCLAWKNKDNSLKTDKDGGTTNYCNVVFADDAVNSDIMTGPNFVDPDNEDYRIRPSYLLLNKGDNDEYRVVAGLEKVYKEDESTIDYAKTLANEKDLYNLARLIGDKVDIGAYECDSKLQPIIYVKAGSATNGTGESWDSPTNDLQGAINTAELYANTNQTSPYGYVFVDRTQQAKDIAINMPGVKVYGGMNGETRTTERDLDSKENIEAEVSDLLAQRKGVIEQNSRSQIAGLTISNTSTEKWSVVDGFQVTGTATLTGKSAIATSVVDANVSGNSDGLLYNSLAQGTVADVKTVNVTATGTLPGVTGSAANRASAETVKAKYVTDDYWKYQLTETSSDINANTASTETDACIEMVMHSNDLAGNHRKRDNVDNGCFETWYLTDDYTATSTDYPHGKSVVYVEKDKELKLDNSLYSEANAFSPGFLLLKYHAGLRGNNSYVSLTNFAVERDLTAGKPDLFVLPYSTTGYEFSDEGATATDLTSKYYDGAKRANYSYKYEGTGESPAWVNGNNPSRNTTTGLRIESDKAMTVRYYGMSYEEKDGRTNESLRSTVSLIQNNNQQPWSETSNGGLKFTHKENMGWNLFGSPYLCAMNYSDMEYGRVIYAYDAVSSSYKAINTDGTSDNGATDGYIPAMDAVFTQTATLDNSTGERFAVSHSEGKASEGAYAQSRAMLNVVLETAAEASTRANDNLSDSERTQPVSSDALQLNAVPKSEAKSDFDLGTDGVKWMSATAPQIYAVRNGGRYALLSAVSEAGTVSVGVSVPAEGEYTLSIPADCDASKYETVWLKDAETGKGVNLLDGGYTFQVSAAGETNNRFTITFNRMEDDAKSGIVITSQGNGTIQIQGTQQGDQIRIYGTSGVLAAQAEAQSDNTTVRTVLTDTAIVEVTRSGKRVAVKKVTVR